MLLTPHMYLLLSLMLSCLEKKDFSQKSGMVTFEMFICEPWATMISNGGGGVVYYKLKLFFPSNGKTLLL